MVIMSFLKIQSSHDDVLDCCCSLIASECTFEACAAKNRVMALHQTVPKRLWIKKDLEESFHLFAVTVAMEKSEDQDDEHGIICNYLYCLYLRGDVALHIGVRLTTPPPR